MGTLTVLEVRKFRTSPSALDASTERREREVDGAIRSCLNLDHYRRDQSMEQWERSQIVFALPAPKDESEA